ncbi:MAG: hypothetical protein NTW17_03710 [Candidatus Pacearchaeota archaeon]|nr:hypothetical protein [Candidatus Pacearchaeota archaeon]
MTLLQRIFGRKYETNITYREIEPIFRSLGVNFESVIFPGAEVGEANKYNMTFYNVKIVPTRVDGVVKTVITGDYREQLNTHGFDGPLPAHRLSFRIEDCKLTSVKYKRTQ